MNDFRIKVFLAVARNLSFTKASSELHISQPAISNHIKEIEGMYDVHLFERVKNSISLTWQGRLFLKYAEQINNRYQELEFQMGVASQSDSGELVIGASTTLADYVLPSIMAMYMSSFPDVKLSLVRGSSREVGRLVSAHRVDIGFVEERVGAAEDESIVQSSVLSSDELVLVKSYDNNKIGGQISIPELSNIPLALERNGSASLNTILEVLRSYDIEYSDLNVQVQLDSVESIKNFISSGDNYAILSVSSIRPELLRNELSIVEIIDMKFLREFLIISPIHKEFTQIESKGEDAIHINNQNSLAEKFASFFRHIGTSY